MTGQHGPGLADELLAHIAAFHDGLPQGQGETGDGGAAGKALCQWVYDNAEGLAARFAALEAEKAELVEAVLVVVAATRAYLPPDGIDAQECLNRVIGATDNPKINPFILEAENGRV